MEHSLPKISVVVPVYNREDFIEQCLNSILKQTYPNYEVIVVDDGSKDKTRDILEKFGSKIKLHLNPGNKGVSYSRNKGVELSCGEFIAMTDSDCIVAPNWLEELIKPFSFDESIMMVGGRINDVVSKNYWQIVNKGLAGFVANKSGYVARLVGSNMALRRSFAQENRYEEKFKLASGDDTELCCRCLHKGFKVYYYEEAQISHHHRTSFKGSATQQFLYGYVQTYINIRYNSLPYLNYGSVLVVGFLFFTILGVLLSKNYFWGSVFFLFLYSSLAFYFNCRAGAKTPKEVLMTYPAFYVLFLIFCFGSISYLFIPRKYILNER